MRVTIETTADGSLTLYREDIDEHYHSVKGALAESRHIYVDAGWRRAVGVSGCVRVFEVGFGTGLNAALTARAAADEQVATEYYAVELYPLPQEMTDRLALAQEDDYDEEYRAVNRAPWDESVMINPYFMLTKQCDSLLTMRIPEGIDVVYFDAFAPEKQPEMWDEPVFCRLYKAMRSGGVLTTYCAKGAIRRMLERIGFGCERLAGPPGGKREILRATKP